MEIKQDNAKHLAQQWACGTSFIHISSHYHLKCIIYNVSPNVLITRKWEVVWRLLCMKNRPKVHNLSLPHLSNILISWHQDMNVLKLPSRGEVGSNHTNNKPGLYKVIIKWVHCTFIDIRRKASNKHLSRVAFYSLPILTASGRT